MIFVTGKKNAPVESEGFTLLEILIVITIMGVLLLTARPSFKNTYRNLKISTTSKKIASFISYARQKAILERVKYRLNFDYQGKKYWLTVEKDPVNYPDYYVEVKSKFGKQTYLPEEVTIESYIDFITFYPDGKIDKNSLTLKSEWGDEYILHLGRRVNHVKITAK